MMDEVFYNVKLLLGDTEIPDALLNLYIKTVEQRILNYTNQRVMSKALIYDVFIPMVLETVQENVPNKMKDLKIGTVTEGGRSVVFRHDDFGSIQLAKINNRMDYYKDQLNKYRRIT